MEINPNKKQEDNKNKSALWNWQRYLKWAVLLGVIPLLADYPIGSILAGLTIYAPIATVLSLIFFPRKEIIVAEPKDQEPEDL